MAGVFLRSHRSIISNCHLSVLRRSTTSLNPSPAIRPVSHSNGTLMDLNPPCITQHIPITRVTIVNTNQQCCVFPARTRVYDHALEKWIESLAHSKTLAVGYSPGCEKQLSDTYETIERYASWQLVTPQDGHAPKPVGEHPAPRE